jgi:hypothetical protein
LLADSIRESAMPLVRKFGEMWARNLENINLIPGTRHGGQGVYVLYDGSMPVYVGKGNVKSRVRGARRSKSRGPFWDHFSWYLLDDPKMIHDTEVLILRMLPPYLRSLTKQKGNFQEAVRDKSHKKHPVPDLISRKFPKKRRKKKS